MPVLIHFTLDPFSRRLRLALAEYGVPVELIDEEPWEPMPDIFELNPAGTLPVYLEDASTALSGIEAISNGVPAFRKPKSKNAATTLALLGGLAITMLALGFIFIAAVTVWAVSNAAQRFDAQVFATAALVGLAVCAAWCFGYPRHAAIPAMALVILLAAITLPLVFDMNGALLREASGAPRSRGRTR